MRRFDQINVIPFIDIMLVMLAIVLTTATFIVQGKIPINLPKAESAQSISNKQPITLSIDEQGTIYFQDAPVTIDALSKELLTLPKDTMILLRVDETARFASFITVIDLLQTHQLEQLSIVAKSIQ